MSLRLRDHLVWQDATDLDAFITRLTDSAEQVRANLKTFVVGEKVRRQLDNLLGEMGRRLGDNRDIGRYVYGSFGSGKSHLLTVLGKMLEGDPDVYDLGHPALRKLHADHPWLDSQKVLVVRLNMMDKQSLSTALYTAFNDALPPAIPRLSFTDEQRVFELIDRDAQRLGGNEALVRQIAAELEQRPIAGWPTGLSLALLAEWIQRNRSGALPARLALAAAFQNWRNHGQDEIRGEDLWLDIRPGLDRIARHAHEHGFTAVSWLIDELIIWIRGKNRAEYISQVNTLSAMVDHDAARALPFFVAVAIQQDIALTCPDDLSESDFQAQLGFIKDRFDPRIQLEDQDLYDVCAERVLARKPDRPKDQSEMFEARISALFDNHREAIAAFSGEMTPEFVRRLYPFHPALLRILVDVTQALSRNRTAVAALYVLLNRHGDAEPDKFIPVSALWDFVFTNENVQTLRGGGSTRFNQRVLESFETYQRLEGKIDAVSRDNHADPAKLRSLVKSVLLCQLSDRPYFSDGRALRERITASMLLRLNEADVRVVHERTGISLVANLFRKLQGTALQIQIVGEDADPSIHIKTEQVDYEKVLALARGNVGHPQRFAYVRKLLNEQLGLGIQSGNEATVDVLWRGTRRKGLVRLRNVRTCSYSGQNNDFDPGQHEFLILVDYPFDETAGMGRDNDVQTVESARARGGTWALSWLPMHFSPSEREALDNAAAVDEIRKNESTYFEDVSPREADATRRALEGYQIGRKAELEQAVQRLFFDEGIVTPSKTSLAGVNLAAVDRGRAVESLAAHVLNKRYPSHPEFKRKVVLGDLSQVADWVIRAAKTRQPLDLKSAEMALVESLALPLELAHKGAGSITQRSDGRYLAAVRAWIGDRRSFQAADLRTRLTAEFDDRRPKDADNWGFGFTKELANLWLLYLLQVEEFEARINDKSTTVVGLSELPEKFQLVKDEVVDAPTWDKAKKVAEKLLDVRGRADLPTSPEQAKLFRDVAAPCTELSSSLALFQAQLGKVAVWAGVAGEHSGRRAAALELATFTAGILAESANAARCRRLALATELQAGGKPAPLLDYVRVRAELAGETAALVSVESMKTAFGHIAEVGGDADKTAVVVRLRNILKDPWTAGKLATLLPAWQTEADKRFQAILKAGKKDDEEESKKRADDALKAEAARKAAEAATARKAAEDEARAKAAAEAARVAAEARARAEQAQAEAEQRARQAEAALKKAQEEAARRAPSERQCEGDRETVMAQAQTTLSAAIAANPGAKLRVRIIVETIE